MFLTSLFGCATFCSCKISVFFYSPMHFACPRVAPSGAGAAGGSGHLVQKLFHEWVEGSNKGKKFESQSDHMRWSTIETCITCETHVFFEC